MYEGTQGEFVEEVLYEKHTLDHGGPEGLWVCRVQVHNATHGGVTEFWEGAGTWEHMSWHQVMP